MSNLNNLELEVLRKVSEIDLNLKYHIPFLLVSSREYTGVGVYTNIEYKEESEYHIQKLKDGTLSTNELILFKNLTNGIVYEVSIKNGLIDFIEFVTIDEEWNGKIPEDYQFK